MKIHRLNKLIEMSRTPLAGQPPINRSQLGPMVGAYVFEMFTTCGFKRAVVENVSERFLAQIIRDNVYFYNRARHILDALYIAKEYSDSICGKDLWRGVNNLSDSFSNRGFEDHWDELQELCKRFRPIEHLVYQHDRVIDLSYELEGW